MLDSLLGNVFGRSKKQNNPNNATTIGPNGEQSEGFVVVGQQSTEISENVGHSLYPKVTTMLTQEVCPSKTSIQLK